MFTWRDFNVGDKVEYKYRLYRIDEWVKGVITKSTPHWGITIHFPDNPLMRNLQIPPKFLKQENGEYLKKIPA